MLLGSTSSSLVVHGDYPFPKTRKMGKEEEEKNDTPPLTKFG
jgi:hypothetical protein